MVSASLDRIALFFVALMCVFGCSTTNVQRHNASQDDDALQVVDKMINDRSHWVDPTPEW